MAAGLGGWFKLAWTVNSGHSNLSIRVRDRAGDEAPVGRVYSADEARETYACLSESLDPVQSPDELEQAIEKVWG